MSWKRRTRAVAWTALLLMACTLAMPSASAAFPIKWWINPQLGDPDVPGSGNLVITLGDLTLRISRVGSYTFVIIPVRLSVQQVRDRREVARGGV
jgi:uncharacterized SAM-binding protein YcdF (DUF218 family)